MNQVVILGGIGGAALGCGILLLVAGWNGWGPGELPRWSRGRVLRAVSASGAAVLTWALTGWPVAAVAAAGALLAVPAVVTGRVAEQRIRRLEALEQWTRRLSDYLSAGRGLEQAIEASAGRNVPAAIAGPVEGLARRLTGSRISAEDALRQFADELDDPVGDRIAAALILVSRRRGKGASSVLAGLAELVARDVQNRREVEAARAEHRATVRWIIAILALLTTGAIAQHSYVEPFGTPIGQAVLAVVVACYGGALWWLRRLAMPDTGKRFLEPEPR